MKFCPKCKQFKPEIDFYKNKGRKDNLASECKKCSRFYRQKSSQYFQKYYAIHKKEWNKRGRKWWAIHQKWVQNYLDKKRYNGNKSKVLQRDNYTCQCCGFYDSSSKKLHIHHINEKSFFNTDNPDHSMNNLITLCQSCHIKYHFGKIQLKFT